jgi:hypothetical protein
MSLKQMQILDGAVAVKPEQEPVAWLLTDKNINSLQVDSIQRLIDRLKHAHHTDIRVRINGHDEWFEADWLKHMVRVTPPQPEQKPVTHAVIAGALFDFMGWLTSRKERIVLSSADNASPAVEAITEFAKMRNLSLDDAKVQDWNTTPPQRKPLTDEVISALWSWSQSSQAEATANTQQHAFARSIEAAHGIKE